MSQTFCAKCGAELDGVIDIGAKPRIPCPSCGATSRKGIESTGDTIQTHDKWKFKNKRAGKKEPIWEVTVGDDLYRKEGKWNYLEQHIDRGKNEYLKIVTDPKTGERIRDTKEPLSEHKGHGSAKKKKGKT